LSALFASAGTPSDLVPLLLIPDAPKKIAFQAQKRRWQRHLFSIQQFSRSHKAAITDSVCSGDLAITSADDRRLKIWAVDRPKLKTSYKAPAVVTCLRLDSQANTLWAGCSDKTVRSWPLTGRFRPGLTISHHSEAVTSLALQPGKLLSASLDQTVKETDIATGRLISTLKGHTKGILALDVCLDKQVVLSGSADTTIKVWDLRTGSCQRTIKGTPLLTSRPLGRNQLPQNPDQWRLRPKRFCRPFYSGA
jgi:WD40 repeat protein